jgi:carboxypeptidase PM20D1
METTYPLVHQQLERTIFSEFSYVYKWQGKNASLKPYVIMAHMDVVPVEEAAEKNWSVPSFSGTIKDNYIWGRGAVDDKSSLVAILEAAEQLLGQNYQPERTIYLCFGHDEEIAGLRGMKLIAEWFKSNNIQPALVLDEGGEVNTENMKELNRPLAVLGVGEKGYVTFTNFLLKKLADILQCLKKKQQ